MDDEVVYDSDEVLKNIDNAEVMSLFFPRFRKAVVFDTRSDDIEGPIVRVMPMVASPQERLRSIGCLRPEFPRPRGLTLIPWLRHVDSLVSIGLWDRIVQRFKDSGHDGAVADCNEVLEELRRLERAEITKVVRGENYRTIWSARG